MQSAQSKPTQKGILRPSTGRITLAFLLIALLAASAQAGRIEGTIQFQGDTRLRAGISPYAGRLGGSIEDQKTQSGMSVREVAVYLEGSGAQVNSNGKKKPAIHQRAIRFDPRVLIVPVGTEIAFPNDDPVFHNVFSYSKSKRFDLGRYGKGKSKDVLFDKPGLVKVFCDVHRGMSAYVLVVESPWSTQPDDGGHFILEDIPEGQHELVLWHPEKGEQRFQLTVGEETLKIDLSW